MPPHSTPRPVKLTHTLLPIETPRLRLRRLEIRDATRLATYRSDASVARYQSWDAMTLPEAEELINTQPAAILGQPDQWSQLAIADKTTDDLIGDIGICKKRSPEETVEIGFTLAPTAQRCGLAAEACRAAIQFTFSVSTATSIVAVIDARNTPAIALVQRLGMSLDHSEPAMFKGEVCSEHHFVLRR